MLSARQPYHTRMSLLCAVVDGVAGEELQKRLELQLAAPDHPKLTAFLVQVQGHVLESGRWHAAAGFVHAVGAGALVQVRRAQACTQVSDAEAALKMVSWLWDGDRGAARLGTAKAFMGLRGLLSFGVDMWTAASPVVAATTAVAELGVALMTDELTVDKLFVQLTAHLGSACTALLTHAEDELRCALE
eukprot:7389591-Prymnesium_polylepis.2